jgi:hypothetical protein
VKARVKLPRAAKEFVDGVSSLVDLAGEAVASGSKAVRHAKRAVRKAGRTAAAVRRTAGLGRDAVSKLGAAARTGDAEIDLDSGTVIFDLRGDPADGDEGDDT